MILCCYWRSCLSFIRSNHGSRPVLHLVLELLRNILIKGNRQGLMSYRVAVEHRILNCSFNLEPCLYFSSGLQPYLDQLGFHIVGYGCTTCIGNSGDLDESVSAAISENGNSTFHKSSLHTSQFCKTGFFLNFQFHWSTSVSDIVAAAVLSGNRNFEGRVHPLTRANYLASPPLVVAYALAGTVYNYKNHVSDSNFCIVLLKVT